MVVLGEVFVWRDVVVEQPAVVDDARNQLHVVRVRGREHELAGPGLHRSEDHHRPVDRASEALEALDDVEREAVRRAGRDAEKTREPRRADSLHARPHGLASEAGAVGVVQQQHVEPVDAAAFEAALGRHPDVVRVRALGAQTRIGEARIALRAFAPALVEVVAYRPDHTAELALVALERTLQRSVRAALAVHVRGDQRFDALAGAQQRR